MGLVQIVLIWGVASAALFPFPVYSGEWENFKELQDSIVRSAARRDRPLPSWAISLDYRRPQYFWDLKKSTKEQKSDETPVLSSPVSPDIQSK